MCHKSFHYILLLYYQLVWRWTRSVTTFLTVAAWERSRRAGPTASADVQLMCKCVVETLWFNRLDQTRNLTPKLHQGSRR